MKTSSLRLSPVRSQILQRSFALVVLATVVAALGIVGCVENPPDRTAVRLAAQVTHDQAEQNKRLADATKSLTHGSQQLVTAEAKARQEVISLQRDLRQDQADIGRQRDALEADRRQIANQRLTDSTWSATLLAVGVLIACLAPLVLAGITLLGLWRSPSDEELHEVLVEHLTGASDVPTAASILPQPSALSAPESFTPRLPGESDRTVD
ncbi:MAG: hypothetical protein U1A77_24895 [Pirellulales bacterium]